MKPIIFLRVAWMINYQGVTKLDQPNGAGSYVKENNDGGEVVNFFPVGNKYFGYARIRKGNDLRIERLGAQKSDDAIDNVTVVFFATNPYIGGQYVVGWYDDATLFRSLQLLPRGRKNHLKYLAVTDQKKGELLPVGLRKFEVPDDGPGQTNAWYVMEYEKADTFLESFDKFKKNPQQYKKPGTRKPNRNKGWLQDAELRKKVEMAAMDATDAYFSELGYQIDYVHTQKVGWDMEAEKKHTKLKLEVKGTLHALHSVELTPNEYMHSLKLKHYRVCILEHALDRRKARLHVCQLHPNKKLWISELGEQLRIIPITSAQLKIEGIDE